MSRDRKRQRNHKCFIGGQGPKSSHAGGSTTAQTKTYERRGEGESVGKSDKNDKKVVASIASCNSGWLVWYSSLQQLK